MRILVTGTTGLVGSSLLKILVSKGHKVKATLHSTNAKEYIDGVNKINKQFKGKGLPEWEDVHGEEIITQKASKDASEKLKEDV